MSKIISLQFFPCFFSSLSFLLIKGLAETPPETKTSTTGNKKSTGVSTAVTVVIVLVGVVAVAVFSVFLYKLWQRKKREEQHMRLLKLFEQDDELEVELGMRD